MWIVAIQMGRPSKHRLQATASLRQRDLKLFKVSEDADENGWHAELPTSPTGYIPVAAASPSGYVARLGNPWRPTAAAATDDDDELMMTGDEVLSDRDDAALMMRRGDVSPMTTTLLRRRLSDSLTVSANECAGDVDMFSAADTHCALGDVAVDPAAAGASLTQCHYDVRNSCCADDVVTVKTECTADIVPASMHCASGALTDKQFTVSWAGARARGQGTTKQQQQQHVLSGGYCCERDVLSTAATTPVLAAAVSDDFCSTSLSASRRSHVPHTSSAASVSLSHTPSAAVSLATAAAGTATCGAASTHTTTAATQSTVSTAAVHCQSESPDDGQSAGSTMLTDMSPGSKWHVSSSERDSPYVSVMALASSCHLFSESCPSSSAADDDSMLVHDQTSSSEYWLHPDLPDENVIFTEKHCEMINQITAAYDRYVQTGTIINETLVTEMKVTAAQSRVQPVGVCVYCK